MIPRRGPMSGHPLRVSDFSARGFWQRVQKSDGCWLWRGVVSNGGYGTMGVKGLGRPVAAHRISYVLHTKATLPPGMCVLHRCDNRLCVNPAHLFLGTHDDNMLDMVAKGRAARRTKDVCLRGHDRVPGGGQCAECVRERYRLDSARRRQAVTRLIAEYREHDLAAALPPTIEALAAAIDERRAYVVAENLGLYGRESRALEAIAVDLHVTRERARQLRNSGLQRAGVDHRVVLFELRYRRHLVAEQPASTVQVA